MSNYVVCETVTGYSPANGTCQLISRIRDLDTGVVLSVPRISGGYYWYPKNMWDIDNDTLQFTIIADVSTAGYDYGTHIIAEQGVNLFCGRRAAINAGWTMY